jgi:hypothetical protein
MIGSDDLLNSFALNTRLLHLQSAGLSHADSLIQPPYNGNCLNWVLGHITVSRDRVLVLLGVERKLSNDQRLFYETGSEPIKVDAPGVIPLEKLLEILTNQQQNIGTRLESMTDQELNRPVHGQEDTRSIMQRIFGLYFHDTYHTGQTEQLRQLTGVNDKVV